MKTRKIQTKISRLKEIVQQKVQRKTWRKVNRTKIENDQEIEGKIQYCSWCFNFPKRLELYHIFEEN